MQNTKAIKPIFRQYRSTHKILSTKVEKFATASTLVRILSEICSVCPEIATSHPAYYFNPQRRC